MDVIILVLLMIDLINQLIKINNIFLVYPEDVLKYKVQLKVQVSNFMNFSYKSGHPAWQTYHQQRTSPHFLQLRISSLHLMLIELQYTWMVNYL